MLILVLTALAAVAAASSPAQPLDVNRVVFVVNSQPDKHHKQLATDARDLLEEELRREGCGRPQVLLVHEESHPLHYHGAWTYYPMIEALAKHKIDDNDWFVFLEENSRLDIGVLKDVLSAHRASDAIFLGHELLDQHHVVTHHYDNPGMSYPLAPAGFVLSRALVKELTEKLPGLRKDRGKYPIDFNIDSSYELTKSLQKMRDRYDDESEPPEVVEAGVDLFHEKRFCANKDTETQKCAIWPEASVTICNATDERVQEIAEKTFFGVKTCEKFHEKRLPIIFDTWARAVPHVEYFSEVADANFGTSALPGVKNTERGHCGKTLAIIRYFYEEKVLKKGFDWLVITDDDTMLGGRKMLEHLNCYQPTEPVMLGQRYGFRMASGHYGYDYPTGGGGMVLSRTLVKKMLERQDACACRSDDQPDDMHLGACVSSLGIPMVHSPRFHQTRPEDYPKKLLDIQVPVSFHKFWNTDPRRWYANWFEHDDQVLIEHKRLLTGLKKDEL